jgi:hypothetical protein
MRTTMKSRSLILCSAIVLSVELLVPRSAWAQAGQSGLAFLKLGVSGRGVALADAMAASVSGSAANYYNPAGLIWREGAEARTQFMFMHKAWIQDTRIEFLGGMTQIGDENAIGAHLISTSVPDIEVRTVPGEAQGTFTASDLAVGVSFAHKFGQNVRAGITAKYLYEKIFVDNASGFAADLGVQADTPIENLKAAFTLANLGGMSTMRNEKTALPALMRLGTAYDFDISDGRYSFLLAADGLYVFPESRTYLNLGTEAVISRLVSIRAGYQFGSQARGLSAGLGLAYGVLALDYAYARLTSDLGNAHTISLAVNL